MKALSREIWVEYPVTLEGEKYLCRSKVYELQSVLRPVSQVSKPDGTAAQVEVVALLLVAVPLKVPPLRGSPRDRYCSDFTLAWIPADSVRLVARATYDPSDRSIQFID